ncbi:hypothetical protein C451_20390 [Halococcus thailandensis JCM 13552]|uniref:Uncharacterized protein n=1 Tax=Halococcus thailandensis JCM 13552 TaxID=1227457 RepID=M0MUJ8_9EURY|nr:hypothetical protein [Halococcus thailandensis]EMA48444.1 hypothetical protein C451_20390 [Halococcus thailandensis JCM 13552]
MELLASVDYPLDRLAPISSLVKVDRPRESDLAPFFAGVGPVWWHPLNLSPKLGFNRLCIVFEMVEKTPIIANQEVDRNLTLLGINR